MAEPPPFVYDPLSAGSIRLLTPVSSEAADGYTWKLQTVALDRFDLEFDALSYVWGSDSERLNVTLNDCATQVHRNLYTALPYLARRRDIKPVRPIWIDAICINQADHEEKMVQIREMNRVYKQAKKVWIWLGTTKHQYRIPDAVLFLKSLREDRESYPSSDTDERERRLKLQSADLSLKSAIYHLTYNDWYGRLWVVQEAALARDLVFLCGDIGCDWEIMKSAMKDVRSWEYLDNELSRCGELLSNWHRPMRAGRDRFSFKFGIYYLRNITQRSQDTEIDLNVGDQTLSMAAATNFTGTQECLRPEDRVFGILGLMESEHIRGTCLDPEIGYISVEDLFIRFTRFVLTMFPEVEFDEGWRWLSRAFELGKRERLPSWVPDWHLTAHSHQWNLGQDYDIPSRYSAVEQFYRPRPGKNPEQLMLKGRVIDEVVTVFAMIASPDPRQGLAQPEKRRYMAAFAHWEESIADEAMGRTPASNETWPRVVNTEETFPKSYWHTLVNYQELYGDEPITQDWYLEFRAMGRRLRSLTTSATTQNRLEVETDSANPQSITAVVEDTEELLYAEDQYTNAYKFLHAMQWSAHKQLFNTRRNHFSSTTKGVMPGDVLVALNGAPMLHVMRKVTVAKDDEYETWKFVGEAYVYPQNFDGGNEITLEESDNDGPHAEEREFVVV